MSKKCFSSCRKNPDCNKILVNNTTPLCKTASGTQRNFCRLNKYYYLNKSCDMVFKENNKIIEKSDLRIANKIKKDSLLITKKRFNKLYKNTEIKPKNKTIKKEKKEKSMSRSYRPTINRDLVSLKSIERENVLACNLKEFKKPMVPLKIQIDGECISVFEDRAKQYLLQQLSSNKHLNINKVITPKQNLSNCWFNVMFVLFFISDKGRQFFHYFRTLMILGQLSNGDEIPIPLRYAFSLLNYIVETCLSGNKKELMKLNTNDVIKRIYDKINYYSKHIYDVDNNGNPIAYYNALVQFMSLKSTYIKQFLPGESINNSSISRTKPPHIIVLTYNDVYNSNKKQIIYKIHKYKYKLDSCCIRDTGKRHFIAYLTCNNMDYTFDGDNYKNRLAPMEWKDKINTDIDIPFNNKDVGDGYYYNFMTSYQLLFYYRIK